MPHSSPHRAADYIAAASLRVIHEFSSRARYRSVNWQKNELTRLREIDICAGLAQFFGPSSRLAAQGIGGPDGIDLVVRGPTIRCEVKYFRPRARQWAGQITRDWEWLLGAQNVGHEFRKRCWVVFWPSTRLFNFTQCLGIPLQDSSRQYAPADYLPFLPYAEPVVGPYAVNERLQFRVPDLGARRECVIRMFGGRCVRLRVVGDFTFPLWAVVYERIVGDEVCESPCVQV